MYYSLHILCLYLGSNASLCCKQISDRKHCLKISILKSHLNHTSPRLFRRKKNKTVDISIYVCLCSYLVKHPCHHISFNLMENSRDALLMFHSSDILLSFCLFLSSATSGPPRQLARDVSEELCMCCCCITAQIMAHCSSEHPAFHCPLSGRRTATCRLRSAVLHDVPATGLQQSVTLNIKGKLFQSNDIFCVCNLNWLLHQFTDQ